MPTQDLAHMLEDGALELRVTEFDFEHEIAGIPHHCRMQIEDVHGNVAGQG